MSVAGRDERHTKGHTKPKRESFGKWQRHLLLEAVEAARLEEGKVKWSALVERLAPDSTTNKSHRYIATSLSTALERLETAELVRVNPGRTSGKRRVIRHYSLTAKGQRRAEELQEHGGITRAAAKRRPVADRALHRAVSSDHERRSRAERLADVESFGMESLIALEERLGDTGLEPGGDVVLEAAKRFLRIAQSRWLQSVGFSVSMLRTSRWMAENHEAILAQLKASDTTGFTIGELVRTLDGRAEPEARRDARLHNAALDEEAE